MEVLVGWFFVATIFGIIGLWFGNQRNRPNGPYEGFWLGFFLGPFGWLLALLLPGDHALVSGTAQTIPEQSGYGRCPTCGGMLVGQYPKCPHCASDVFWVGRVPIKTAQEAADAKELQDRLADERAAERAAEREELKQRNQRELRQWAVERAEARRQWRERRPVVLSALVSGARWLVRKFDEVLRKLGQHRQKTQATKYFVASRLWLRKVHHVLRGWAGRIEQPERKK